MITDDQVVALLRDAGNDGPLPRPLDPTYAVAEARRGRTRTQALSGLAVALAAVLILTEPGRVLLTAAAGGATVARSPGVSPAYLAPVLLALVILAAGLATPFARRLRDDAVLRRLLAALWGVLALLLAGLFPEGGVLLAPSYWEALSGGRFWSPWAGLVVVVPILLAAGALLARRTLHPASIRPLSGAAWLNLCLACGWALAALVVQPVTNSARGGTALDAVALAAALAVAVALGAAAHRRLPTGSPWSRSSGATLLVVATSSATILGLMVPPAFRGVTGSLRAGGAAYLVVAAVVLVVLALVGARLALPSQARSRLTGVLAVAVVPLSVQSGQSLMSAMAADPRTGVVHPASGLIWGGVLAVLAVAALVVVDRCTSPPAVEDEAGAEITG